MASEVEIERCLATVTSTLNDQRVEEFDRAKVQEIVTSALGSERSLAVDLGGGLHDRSGARVGAIRRADSGEWIAERQNEAAPQSHAAIPSVEAPGSD